MKTWNASASTDIVTKCNASASTHIMKTCNATDGGSKKIDPAFQTEV